MIVPLILSAGAALAGLARGGSLDSLAATRFRWVPTLVGGLLIQVVFGIWEPEWLDSTGELAVLLISNAAVVAFVLANIRLPGMVLIGIGLAMNVAVIALNGSMPVSARAAEIAGVNESLNEATIKHESLEDDTILPWLGDVIPIPVIESVLSIGDVVLALGMSLLVYVRTMAGRRKPAHRLRRTKLPVDRV